MGTVLLICYFSAFLRQSLEMVPILLNFPFACAQSLLCLHTFVPVSRCASSFAWAHLSALLSVLRWFCFLLVSVLKSYSLSDTTDLPLCEAYRRRDSWASPGTGPGSAQGDEDEHDGPPSQETKPQHHLNGHGTTSIEKPWSAEDTPTRVLYYQVPGCIPTCCWWYVFLLFFYNC